MGRMHTPGLVVFLQSESLFFVFVWLFRKGISRSALPYRRTPPSWCKVSAETVVDEIKKYARKGMTPSQIGVVLRDSMGIPQVNTITGSKILRVLRLSGVLFWNLLAEWYRPGSGAP
jgi:hypothetical protein